MPCFLSVQPQLHSKKAAQKPKQDQPGAGMKIVAGPLARLPAPCQVRRKISSSAWVEGTSLLASFAQCCNEL